MVTFIFTIIAFIGVVIINVFTYLGVDLSSVFPALNLSFIILFIMTSILFFKVVKSNGGLRNRVDLSVAYSKLSTIERIAVSVCGIYVIICLLVNLFYMSDGGTGIHEGKYAILDKGRFQRFITEEMYFKYQLIELRLITSTFMLMGVIALIGYYQTNFASNFDEEDA